METKTTFTRHDYMNNKCSHFEYYSQFVTEGMKSVILNKYSKEQLKEKFAEDQHLNNIPLKWWDSFEWSCGKMGFYAHELGELTQWAQVFNTGERKAHRINKSMRVKGMKYISKPFNSESEAMAAIKERSEMNVQYF